jgi:hypothetical protein
MMQQVESSGQVETQPQAPPATTAATIAATGRAVDVAPTTADAEADSPPASDATMVAGIAGHTETARTPATTVRPHMKDTSPPPLSRQPWEAATTTVTGPQQRDKLVPWIP